MIAFAAAHVLSVMTFQALRVDGGGWQGNGRGLSAPRAPGEGGCRVTLCSPYSKERTRTEVVTGAGGRTDGGPARDHQRICSGGPLCPLQGPSFMSWRGR